MTEDWQKPSSTDPDEPEIGAAPEATEAVDPDAGPKADPEPEAEAETTEPATPSI